MKNLIHGRQMSTVFRGKPSIGKQVTSRVPQGSMLAPIMFTLFINDLRANLSLSTYMNMLTMDTKLQL